MLIKTFIGQPTTNHNDRGSSMGEDDDGSTNDGPRIDPHIELEAGLSKVVPHQGFRLVLGQEQLELVSKAKNLLIIKTHYSDTFKQAKSAKEASKAHINPRIHSWVEMCKRHGKGATIGTFFAALPFNPYHTTTYEAFCIRMDPSLKETMFNGHEVRHLLWRFGQHFKQTLHLGRIELLAGKASEGGKSEFDPRRIWNETLRPWGGPWRYTHPIGVPVSEDIERPDMFTARLGYEYEFGPHSRYCSPQGEGSSNFSRGSISHNTLPALLVEMLALVFVDGFHCMLARAIELLSSGESPVWASAVDPKARRKKLPRIPDEVLYQVWKEVWPKEMMNQGHLGSQIPAEQLPPNYDQRLQTAHGHFRAILTNKNKTLASTLIKDLDGEILQLEELNSWRVDHRDTPPSYNALRSKVAYLKRANEMMDRHKAKAYAWHTEFNDWFWSEWERAEAEEKERQGGQGERRRPESTTAMMVSHRRALAAMGPSPPGSPHSARSERSERSVSPPPGRQRSESTPEPVEVGSETPIATGNLPRAPSSWDPRDYIVALGIEAVQDATDNLAISTYEARRRRGESDRGPDPRVREARGRCRWPYLDRKVELFWHQIDHITVYLALAFSGDAEHNRVASALLADDAGLGKTHIMAALIAILKYYHDRMIEDPSWKGAPVMASWKPEFFTGPFAECVSSGWGR